MRLRTDGPRGSMIETHEIRYFVSLAREGHFGRAAFVCGVSQPAMTRGIRKLEEKLGGMLFDRRPGRAELTVLGRMVLPRFEAALQEIETALESAAELHGTRLSTLRLGVMCTLGPARLIPLVTEFAKLEKNVELVICEARAGAVLDMLTAAEIDIGIASWPDYPDGVEARRCFTERYAVAVPAGNPLAGQPSIDLDQLDGSRYLQRLNCEFDEHFSAQIGEWPINLVTRFSSEREDWIQSMVSEGNGFSIVPEYMDVSPGVAVRPLSRPSVTRTVALLTIAGLRRTAAADTFIELAERHDWTHGQLKNHN